MSRIVGGHVRWLAASLLLVLSWGCGRVLDPGEVQVLEVAETLVPCHGPFPQECHLVRSAPGDAWQLFYDPIHGFDYEWGQRYVLEVSRRAVPNPPADGSAFTYRLEAVVSKTPSDRAEPLARARQAETLWREARPVSYSMVQERICYCLAAAIGPVRLDVVRTVPGWSAGDEEVIAVHYVAGGGSVPNEYAQHFLPVRDLFGRLYHAIAAAYSVTAEFDDATGYPRRIFIDWMAGIADDEVEYVVHAVTGGSGG